MHQVRLTKREKRIQRQNRRKEQKTQSQHETNTRLNFSLKEVVPLTKNQSRFFDLYDDGYELIFLKGSAGTGKSYIAVYKALEEILETDSTYKKVVIIRSAVQSREIGHMPGSAKEKVKLFELPYMQICSDLFDGKDPYNLLCSRGVIEFTTTSFIRGLTFNDSIIIVDETQNMTFPEISTVMSRVGDNSRIIFCGDFRQNDLYRRDRDQSGLPKFLRVISKMQSSATVDFTTADVVRSGIVKEFLIALEKDDDSYGNDINEEVQSMFTSVSRTGFGDYTISRQSI